MLMDVEFSKFSRENLDPLDKFFGDSSSSASSLPELIFQKVVFCRWSKIKSIKSINCIMSVNFKLIFSVL